MKKFEAIRIVFQLNSIDDKMKLENFPFLHSNVIDIGIIWVGLEKLLQLSTLSILKVIFFLRELLVVLLWRKALREC